MIGDRWGVSPAEVARHYACDDVVPEPTMAAWRGVSVAVAPERVWPWVVQMRLAPYSYDWVDNFGRRSPRDLRHLPDPVPGDPFTATADHPIGQVLSVEHGVHLTAQVLGATMTYHLSPADDGPARSRLVLKVVAAVPRVTAVPVCLGDLVMARKQLLNLKALAEGRRR